MQKHWRNVKIQTHERAATNFIVAALEDSLYEQKHFTHSSNILICVLQNKGTHSSLEQQEGELMMTDFWVNYLFFKPSS